MQRKFTLDVTELNFYFFLQCFPLREQQHFHQQLRRRRALIRYVCYSPFKISLFFLFMQRKFTLDATEPIFLFARLSLREQRHFHQQLRRRRDLIRYVCYSPLKFPFFPFFMQMKVTLDATELNFSFYKAVPSEYSDISTNSSDDVMPLFVMSVLLL
jgi:hypothetical protein